MRHIPDDRRYMSYEARAAEGDERFIIREVKPKDKPVKVKPLKEVAAAGHTCTVRFAVGGACGKPAVFAFKASTGETFAECAEHRA